MPVEAAATARAREKSWHACRGSGYCVNNCEEKEYVCVREETRVKRASMPVEAVATARKKTYAGGREETLT